METVYARVVQHPCLTALSSLRLCSQQLFQIAVFDSLAPQSRQEKVFEAMSSDASRRGQAGRLMMGEVIRTPNLILGGFADT